MSKEVEEAVRIERKRCADILSLAREGIVDPDLRSIRSTIEGGQTVEEIRAELDPESNACDHAGYSFAKMGRCCFKCGEFMVDWGD